jgi:uncharacterized protein (DUF2141 family)
VARHGRRTSWDAASAKIAKESLTVTIDGAKAKAGALSETVRITKKGDPTVAASVDVSATIQ